MLQELRRQYGTVRSPWAEYATYSFPDASLVNPGERKPLMDAMNSIIAVNWKAAEPHWTEASSPFDSKFSLILVYASSGLVAFSVYRALRIAGRPAIYRSGTEVLPTHQGRGLYGFFTTEILKSADASANSDAGLLYGWRTRNPIVWAANAQNLRKSHPLAARRRPGTRIAGRLRRDVLIALPRQSPRNSRHDHARRVWPYRTSPADLSRLGIAG